MKNTEASRAHHQQQMETTKRLLLAFRSKMQNYDAYVNDASYDVPPPSDDIIALVVMFSDKVQS